MYLLMQRTYTDYERNIPIAASTDVEALTRYAENLQYGDIKWLDTPDLKAALISSETINVTGGIRWYNVIEVRDI